MLSDQHEALARALAAIAAVAAAHGHVCTHDKLAPLSTVPGGARCLDCGTILYGEDL